MFFWILVGLFALGLCWVCGSIPYSVDADDDYIGEHRPLYTKKYRYSDIRKAERLNPDDVKGMHFHGKYKNPVLITLKDGRTFVIGSDDSQQLVDYINSRVS